MAVTGNQRRKRKGAAGSMGLYLNPGNDSFARTAINDSEAPVKAALTILIIALAYIAESAHRQTSSSFIYNNEISLASVIVPKREDKTL